MDVKVSWRFRSTCPLDCHGFYVMHTIAQLNRQSLHVPFCCGITRDDLVETRDTPARSWVGTESIHSPATFAPAAICSDGCCSDPCHPAAPDTAPVYSVRSRPSERCRAPPRCVHRLHAARAWCVFVALVRNAGHSMCCIEESPLALLMQGEGSHERSHSIQD